MAEAAAARVGEPVTRRAYRYCELCLDRPMVVVPEVGAGSRGVLVRPAEPDERGAIVDRLKERWGASTTIIAIGRGHDLRQLPALVARIGGELAGVATYDIESGECQLVALDAFHRAARRWVSAA